MNDISDALAEPLAELLESRLLKWKDARDPQEQKMLDAYADVMRITRDDDHKWTGLPKAKKARGLFMGSTRNKVRSARAKINDSLFGSGKLPFDTTPTKEDLAPYSDTLETILKEQLERGKFKSKLSAGTNTLATYGTGFMIGPLVRRESLTQTYADTSAGFTQIKEQTVEFDLPYFDLANTLDVYPDPDAQDMKDALGCFWVTLMSPETVRAWKTDKDYKNVDAALTCLDSGAQSEGSEKARQLRGHSSYWQENGRVRVARYFGKVPASALDDEEREGEDDGEQVDVVVIMAGGVVVKVDESPWGIKKPVLPCVYEAADHEIWGVGVAENNAPNQKNINAAFRLMNETKGIALNPPISVDRSKFASTEDFKFGVGKVYQFKPNLSPDDRKNAVIVHTMPDVSGGWMDLISMSEQFSDDDTGITKYTQGDDASNLNKTASGISMIMSASSLPIKEVIQNIDTMWIEPMIEALIEWNLKYLEADTVEKIHGEEHAKRWAEIKEFGKSSFVEWQATGTQSFMQKEILVNKIRAFAEFALSNPMTAQKIDVTEMLEQTWDVMEIGKESPILKDEKNANIPPQIQQEMQQKDQMLQQLDQTVQAMSGELESKEADRAAVKEQKTAEMQMSANQKQIDHEATERQLKIRLDAERQLMREREQLITDRELKLKAMELQSQQQQAREAAIWTPERTHADN